MQGLRAAAVVTLVAIAACANRASRGASSGGADGGSAEDHAAVGVGATSAGPAGESAAIDAATDATAGPALVAEDASPVAPDASTAEPRLGWPADKDLAGIYATIDMVAAPTFRKLLAQVAANGMNAVVVDGKDYQGWLTYPSSIPLAAAIHASSK